MGKDREGTKCRNHDAHHSVASRIAVISPVFDSGTGELPHRPHSGHKDSLYKYIESLDTTQFFQRYLLVEAVSNSGVAHICISRKQCNNSGKFSISIQARGRETIARLHIL
jgi:hypothetical protein